MFRARVSRYCHDTHPYVRPSVRPSLCLSVWDDTVHDSADKFMVGYSNVLDILTLKIVHLLPVVFWKRGGIWMCTLGVISLRTVEDIKLLLSANRKSYMPRGLAQQRMTLSDLEWPFHGSSVYRLFGRGVLTPMHCCCDLSLEQLARSSTFYNIFGAFQKVTEDGTVHAILRWLTQITNCTNTWFIILVFTVCSVT